MTSATTTANTHRNAGNPGSRPVQTSVVSRVPGTLNIAGQISVSMPASGWIAVTDRVLDRTENWTSDIYNQIPEYGLDLTQTIPSTANAPVISPGAETHLKDAGRITDTAIPSREDKDRADEGESSNGYEESMNDASGIAEQYRTVSVVVTNLLLGRSSTAVNTLLGIGTTLLSQMQVTAAGDEKGTAADKDIFSADPEDLNDIIAKEGNTGVFEAPGDYWTIAKSVGNALKGDTTDLKRMTKEPLEKFKSLKLEYLNEASLNKLRAEFAAVLKEYDLFGQGPKMGKKFFKQQVIVSAHRSAC